MSQAKAKISLSNGSIELEGDEEFVRTYLDEFKGLLVKRKTDVSKEGQKDKEQIKTEGTDTVKKKTSNKNKKNPQKIVAERFDIHGGDNVPALKDFIEEKKPGKSNVQIIAVIGYYITELLGNDNFTEGQLEYAYKMLKLKRPKHLHQIIVNIKNRYDYFEQDAEGANWILTRAGEIYVSEQLPGSDQ